MAVGGFSGIGGSGIGVTKKKPGHFVVLTEDGRVEALLSQNVKLSEVLEKRAPISINTAMQGPNDGPAMTPAPGVKSVDPYDISIAMPASDGEPVVSDFERDAWSRWRVAWDVTLDLPPFKVTGVLLLLPSADPMSLTERGTELFLPVFAPTVQVNGITVKDTPRDAVLVNRSHLRRVNASMKR